MSENLPVVDKLMKAAKDKGEAAVVASMEALKKAIDSKGQESDRGCGEKASGCRQSSQG